MPEPQDELLRKVPPHSKEAERSVLGALLLRPETADEVATILRPQDFYLEAHGHIYEMIQDLRNRGQPPDIVVLKTELERKGLLESVGGPAALAEIADSVPTAANVDYYARIVKDRSLLRALIRVSAELQREAFESRDRTEEILDRAERKLFDVTQKRITTQAVSMAEVLEQVFQQIALVKSGKGVAGLASGFVDLDEHTHGFHRGELTILAARPSMGKTTFALNLLRNLCLVGGHAGVFFSLEMPARTLVENLLCSIARVDSHRLRGGYFDADEERRLIEAGEVLEKQRIFIDDQPSLTTMELRAKARRLRAQEAIDLVMIDYLQLMAGSGPSKEESRQQEVSEISRSLKAVSRELEVPVIALSQLSRKVEDRPDHKPRLSDLRESGSIEQDADLVLLLHREEYYKPDKEEVKNRAQLIVAKNRNGPTGEVELGFFRQFMRFENLQR